VSLRNEQGERERHTQTDRERGIPRDITVAK